MAAELYPERYSEGSSVQRRTWQEWLATEELSESLADPRLAPGRTYRDLVARVYELPYEDSMTYGDLLGAQDLRYAGRWGYDRQLMALDVGIDADPVGHNFSTFHHIRNVLGAEEERGHIRLTPYQETVVLLAGLVHDLVEGVVTDVPRGEKTKAFLQLEARERSIMLHNAWQGIIPEQTIDDVDAIIRHEITRSELELVHACAEVGHGLTQFYAGLDAGKVCFWILEDPSNRLALSPLGKVRRPFERFGKLAGLAVEVSRNTTWELAKYAAAFWIARDTLQRYAVYLEHVQAELAPLAASLMVS